MLFPSTAWMGGFAPVLGWVVVLYAAVIGVIALSLFLVISARHVLRAARLGGPGVIVDAVKNVTESLFISVLSFIVIVGVFYALIWLIVYQPLIALVLLVALPLASRPISVAVWRAIHRASCAAEAAKSKESGE
jgi:hypothetical protein